MCVCDMMMGRGLREVDSLRLAGYKKYKDDDECTY